MSVALQIPACGAEPVRLIPIATETVYASEWLPLADSIGATWLPRFQTGADVGYDDPAQVAGEFDQAAARFTAEGKPEFAARAVAVVKALRGAAANSRASSTLFVGSRLMLP